jgi:3-deoxy-D-manno-octulosonic-acid transferase
MAARAAWLLRAGRPGRRASAVGRADVLLGDSMGEMFAYYAACDCAFIGGSLLPLGGQNLIEACALGKPVLVGEHTFNFPGRFCGRCCVPARTGAAGFAIP